MIAPTARRRGLLALCVTGVLWGSIGVVVRLLQDHGSSTAAIAFWRFVCASLILVPALGRSGLGRVRGELRRPGRLVAVSVGSLAFQLLYFLAVRDVGVSAATLVTLGLAPVALTVVEVVAARTLPSARTTLVLVAALTGLALVTATGGSDVTTAPHPARGVLEALASGLFYAASTAWSSRLAVRVEPLAIILATCVAGLVVLFPVVAATGWGVPHAGGTVSGILWLGAVTTVLAYGLFYAGLPTMPGSVAMVLTLLEPITAVLLAAALLGEPLTWSDALGGALLLAAIVVLYLGRPTAAPRRGPPDCSPVQAQ